MNCCLPPVSTAATPIFLPFGQKRESNPVVSTRMKPTRRARSACRKSQCHSEAAKRPWESVLLKVHVFLKIWLKTEHLGERIATPVCELARNDRFFDSLRPPLPKKRRLILLRTGHLFRGAAEDRILQECRVSRFKRSGLPFC